jgi:AcrR family transcriptional regulator
MPPKTQFDSDTIVKAAFEIARKAGLSAITARSVAHQIGSSVAPIYANFPTITDLIRAVTDKIFALSREYLAREQGHSPFERIGRASLAFARDYPVFVRELTTAPVHTQTQLRHQEDMMISLMSTDPDMAGWTTKELRTLLLQMQAFQIGLNLMVANNHLPPWCKEEEPEQLVLKTGADLIRAHKSTQKDRSQ